MKISNELKIGITALVAILVAFMGYRIMKDLPFFDNSNVYYTSFTDATGLESGSVVSYIGVKVGTVTSKELLGDTVLVSMNIERGFEIPKGSIVYLKSPALLGATYVEVIKSSNSEKLKAGDFVKGFYYQGLMDSFEGKEEQISGEISSSISSIDELLKSLNRAMSEEELGKISEALTNVNTMTSELSSLISQKKNVLGATIDGAKNTMSNLDSLTSENKEELAGIIKNMESASRQLDSLSIGLNETTLTLNDILTKINNGEGTLGKMLADSSLYNNLDSLSFNLNELVKGIQEDPKKYLKHMRLIEVF